MNKNPLFFNILIIISMVIWGGSWVSAKAISNIAEPVILTFLRFFVSVIFFIPLLLSQKVSLRIEFGKFKYIMLGSVSMGLYFLFFFKGLKKGYANIGGVFVTSLVPICTLLITKFFMKKKFRIIDYIGVIIGFTGGLVIMKFWSLSLKSVWNSGNLFFIICPFLWALVTISSEKMKEGSYSIAFSFYCHLICMLFFSFFVDKTIYNIFKSGILFWLNILYLSVVSSILATTLYFYATTKINSYRASVYTFFVPVSSLVFSILFLGEKPELTTFIGGALTIFATMIINFRFFFD